MTASNLKFEIEMVVGREGRGMTWLGLLNNVHDCPNPGYTPAVGKQIQKISAILPLIS